MPGHAHSTHRISDFFEAENISVIKDPADNGLEGLRLVRESHPSLVLLDVEMPGLDGYKIASAIKQWMGESRGHWETFLALAPNSPWADQAWQRLDKPAGGR